MMTKGKGNEYQLPVDAIRLVPLSRRGAQSSHVDEVAKKGLGLAYTVRPRLFEMFLGREWITRPTEVSLEDMFDGPEGWSTMPYLFDLAAGLGEGDQLAKLLRERLGMREETDKHSTDDKPGE